MEYIHPYTDRQPDSIRCREERVDQIDFLSSLAARNATFLLALILIASPVAGLRPMRAARLRTCRTPNPAIRMRQPFFRFFTSRAITSFMIASPAFLERSCAAAMSAARCFWVTVVGAALAPFAGLIPMVISLSCQ